MTGPTRAAIDASVKRALRAIAAAQEPDGSFALNEVAAQPPATAFDNLFSTAMVLGLIGRMLPADVSQHAAEYLVARREANGTWAWLPDGTLPQDADDTACCLGALTAAGMAVDRAAGARLLRRFWRFFRGPFRTWLAGGQWSGRIFDDAVVNCNVLWALHELGAMPTASERASVARLVGRTKGSTRYYSSAASVAWAAARVGIATPHLPPPATTALAGRPLECALWSLAAPAARPAASALLLEMQEPDGGWRPEAWIHDHQGAWESRPIVTAYAATALVGAQVGATR